jgi:hypothetical protein
MQRFAVGDHVIIRYGKRAGNSATVIKVLPDQSYQVRSEEGAVLFFTGAGLEQDSATPPEGGNLEQ